MRYATVTTWNDTIVSLTQNEAWSTVYVLKWTAQVENMVWVQTRVIAGQRLSIPRLQASNKDFDISSERVALDAFFQNSDWFLENDGHLIKIGEEEKSNEEEILWNDEISWVSTNLVRFDRLRDEMSTDSSSINISGTILSDNIWAISVQNIPAKINMSSKSFELNSIPLPQAMNDLVIKIYDTERNILQKEVFTVYTWSPSSASASSTGQATTAPQTNTQTTSNTGNTFFDIDATKFRFTSPSTTNRFTTSAWEITIRGETTAEWVSYVEVNGFRLNSFNGRTWRYHAFERFNTIREGTNQYRIDYLDSNEKIIYTDYYTIIKQAPWAATQNQSTPSNTSPSQETPEEKSGDSNNAQDFIPEPESLFWN